MLCLSCNKTNSAEIETAEISTNQHLQLSGPNVMYLRPQLYLNKDENSKEKTSRINKPVYPSPLVNSSSSPCSEVEIIENQS